MYADAAASPTELLGNNWTLPDPGETLKTKPAEARPDPECSRPAAAFTFGSTTGRRKDVSTSTQWLLESWPATAPPAEAASRKAAPGNKGRPCTWWSQSHSIAGLSRQASITSALSKAARRRWAAVSGPRKTALTPNGCVKGASQYRRLSQRPSSPQGSCLPAELREACAAEIAGCPGSI